MIDEILKKVFNSLINDDTNKLCTVGLAIPVSQMNLHREYQHYAASCDGCSGYSGHCSCLNNPCMTCTNAH